MTEEEYEEFRAKCSNPVKTDGPAGTSGQVFAKGISLSNDGAVTKRNANSLVIGSSGSGVMHSFVEPNIQQFNCNFVIPDYSGELLKKFEKPLCEAGYEVDVLDFTGKERFARYNPFRYIETESELFSLVNTLLANTTPPEQHIGDPIWTNGEKLLLEAIMLYIWHEMPPEKQTFDAVLDMLSMSSDTDDSGKSSLDKLFEELLRKDKNSLAAKQYKLFASGSGKTKRSFIISMQTRLAVFRLKEISDLMSEDSLRLDDFADKKRALFVIMPAADGTFDVIASSLYMQLFLKLTKKKAGGAYHVRFFLDERIDMNGIPAFSSRLSTARSFNISFSFMFPTLPWLKTVYGDEWNAIADNCDSKLFLGCCDMETATYFAEAMGKKTVEIRNGSNRQIREAYVMTPDELMNLPENECIYLLRGYSPWRGEKIN